MGLAASSPPHEAAHICTDRGLEAFPTSVRQVCIYPTRWCNTALGALVSWPLYRPRDRREDLPPPYQRPRGGRVRGPPKTPPWRWAGVPGISAGSWTTSSSWRWIFSVDPLIPGGLRWGGVVWRPNQRSEDRKSSRAFILYSNPFWGISPSVDCEPWSRKYI
jgi:hypothetical protein